MCFPRGHSILTLQRTMQDAREPRFAATERKRLSCGSRGCVPAQEATLVAAAGLSGYWTRSPTEISLLKSAKVHVLFLLTLGGINRLHLGGSPWLQLGEGGARAGPLEGAAEAAARESGDWRRSAWRERRVAAHSGSHGLRLGP